MGSFLQIDKKEWENFLDKLAEFEQKYQLLLSKMDTLQSKLEAGERRDKRENEKRDEESQNLVPQLPPQGPSAESSLLDRSNDKTKPRNRADLTFSKIPYAPNNIAYCKSCGYSITLGSRYCTHCGTDFGKRICSCGRELSGSERFCDWCGRSL